MADYGYFLVEKLKTFGLKAWGYQEFSEERLKYRTYLECVCTVTFCHGPEILDHCLCYHGRGGAFSTRLRRCRRWGGWIWGYRQVGLGQPSFCEVKQLNRLSWLRTFSPAAVVRSSSVIFNKVLIWGSHKKTFSFFRIELIFESGYSNRATKNSRTCLWFRIKLEKMKTIYSRVVEASGNVWKREWVL